MADLIVEKDRRIKLVYVTPVTDKGSEWLMSFANERHNFLGKSLVLRRWEAEDAVKRMAEDAVEFEVR